jgi:Fur family ferric uptake transcriptional regulator
MAYCKNLQEVSSMSHHKTAYEDILRAAGHRVTRQRILILDAVCDGGKHTTLGEIYARLRAFDPSIHRSTLYRSLRLFTEVGLVVSAQPGDGETYYEIAQPKHHHHLVCNRCGAETEVSGDVLRHTIEEVRARYGFQIEAAHLVFSGVCAACRGEG